MSDSNQPLGRRRVQWPRQAGKRARSPGADDPAILELDTPIASDTLPLEWDESALTLPRHLHDQDLKVTIEKVWPFNLADKDMITTVEYHWDGVCKHSYELQGPFDPAQVFPLVQYLSKAILSIGGIHRLTYRVSAPLIGAADSFPILINVDKDAPNGGNPAPPLQFDSEARHEVTEEYIVRHRGIPFWLMPWFDMRIGDLLEVFYGIFPDVSLAATFVITRAHVQGAPIEFTIPADHVRDSGSGFRYASGRLGDRGGNVGQFSEATRLKASPVVLPDLPRAYIETAEQSGVLFFEDTWPPNELAITVPQIDGAEAGDMIFPYWNTHPLEVMTVGEVQKWPMRRDVPWLVFAAAGFQSRYPLRVHYLYKRDAASKSSPDSFYHVEPRVFAPDPSGFTPINGRLAKPIVKGVTGDNVLTSEDGPGPVPVEVRLPVNPEPGKRLELCWNSDDVIVAAYDVQLGDKEGMLVTLWVLWAVASSTNVAEVYYWTYGKNPQRSPSTWVTVNLDTLTGLKGPQLLNNSTVDMVACGTVPEPYVGVFIGVLWNFIHFEPGDLLRLYWISYPSKNASGDPFDGTNVFFDHVLTADDRDRGQVEFQIRPFSPLITLPGLVKDFGSAVTRYRLFKATGGTGLSSRKLIYVNLKIPGGGTCLGPA